MSPGAKLVDVSHHDNADLNRNAEQRQEAHSGGHAEMSSARQQRQHTANRSHGNAAHDQQRPFEGIELRVQNDEDQQNGDGDDDLQPLVGALLAFVLAGPVEAVAFRKLHLLIDFRHRLLHRAAEVAAPHAVLDGDIARIRFAVDHGGSILHLDVAELPKRDPLARGREDADVRDVIHGLPELGLVADYEVVAPFALEDLAYRVSTNRRLNGVLNVADVD